MLFSKMFVVLIIALVIPIDAAKNNNNKKKNDTKTEKSTNATKTDTEKDKETGTESVISTTVKKDDINVVKDENGNTDITVENIASDKDNTPPGEAVQAVPSKPESNDEKNNETTVEQDEDRKHDAIYNGVPISKPIKPKLNLENSKDNTTGGDGYEKTENVDIENGLFDPNFVETGDNYFDNIQNPITIDEDIPVYPEYFKESNQQTGYYEDNSLIDELGSNELDEVNDLIDELGPEVINELIEEMDPDDLAKLKKMLNREQAGIPVDYQNVDYQHINQLYYQNNYQSEDNSIYPDSNDESDSVYDGQDSVYDELDKAYNVPFRMIPNQNYDDTESDDTSETEIFDSDESVGDLNPSDTKMLKAAITSLIPDEYNLFNDVVKTKSAAVKIPFMSKKSFRIRDVETLTNAQLDLMHEILLAEEQKRREEESEPYDYDYSSEEHFTDFTDPSFYAFEAY